ncbi:hypothetical protein LIZ64_08850 [[Clostridium] hylemonae]|uniref:hypothetical protein n=1 Tax=[Clostridium] hylemonae TaxID=89153 RepID=UPI001D08F509|nr:hypothetical protein [[Clostridium] hylemonae]MCB7521845.1 hypothetical protein [[Clostridium] hylemonae]
MMDIEPIHDGNCDKLIERQLQITTLPMIRYESVFDFYAEEPHSITVQKESIIESYEPIIRFRKWNVQNESFSWSIYSTNREKLDNIVIRKVVWNIKKDKEFAQRNIKERRQDVLLKWPSITTHNIFIPSRYSKEIIEKVDQLDNTIRHGILLSKNNDPNWEWRDFEIKRLYDWGQIHNTWSTNMKNQDVENNIVDLEMVLNTYITDKCNNAEIIYLNYSILPSKYKEMLEGEQDV